MENKIFVTKSKEETKKIAKEMAEKFKGGEVLLLFGNLGSGKTTFVQGLAEGLRIKERIISPTFIIVREHKVMINDKGLMINKFYHIDLYRVQGSNGINELGLSEILNNKKSIVAIEWAEKLGSLPKGIKIYFDYVSENERKISIACA